MQGKASGYKNEGSVDNSSLASLGVDSSPSDQDSDCHDDEGEDAGRISSASEEDDTLSKWYMKKKFRLRTSDSRASKKRVKAISELGEDNRSSPGTLRTKFLGGILSQCLRTLVT